MDFCVDAVLWTLQYLCVWIVKLSERNKTHNSRVDASCDAVHGAQYRHGKGAAGLTLALLYEDCIDKFPY